MEEALEIQEGLSHTPRVGLVGSTLLQQVQAAWQFTSSRQVEMLEHIAHRTATELDAWLAWVNLLAANRGVHIGVVLSDTPERDY